MPQNGFLNEQGLAIRSARLARSMTQSVLAEGAGVSEKTVRRAEAGERLQAETVLALCSVLQLDPANLRSEAEMDPRADQARKRNRIRLSVLTACMACALVAASLTGVLVARSGGGYRDAAAITLDSPWVNAWILGFGILNAIPMFKPGRQLLSRIPGLADFGRRIAFLEPYGFSITMMLVTYSMATLLPFAIADGWTAFQTGGPTGRIVTGLFTAVAAPAVAIGFSIFIANSDGWSKWTETKLARFAKAA